MLENFYKFQINMSIDAYFDNMRQIIRIASLNNLNQLSMNGTEDDEDE